MNINPNAKFMKSFPDGHLWIGKPSTRTSLHKDRPKNLALTLFGSKTWHVFNRKYNESLRFPKNNLKLEWSEYKEAMLTSIPFQTIKVSKGEMLYLPEQWPHEVVNEIESIMINFWHDSNLYSSEQKNPLYRSSHTLIKRLLDYHTLY